MTDRAAECGVWTDTDFRGHGHAAAVTAAWATMLEPTDRYVAACPSRSAGHFIAVGAADEVLGITADELG